MTIGIFTCFRMIYEQNMKFGTYLILKGAYIRGGLIFGGKFVLVIKGAYILRGGGLYSGGGYIRYFTVFRSFY